jgi:hypothetical protein
LADAVRTLVESGGPEPFVLEALVAYVLVWAHEWPDGFSQAFGPHSSEVLA